MVACGGDGTILQVGKAMLNTNTLLGILPLGSGNGIARHFNIATDIDKHFKPSLATKLKPWISGKLGSTIFSRISDLGSRLILSRPIKKDAFMELSGYMRAFIKAVFSFKYQHFKLLHKDRILSLNPYVFSSPIPMSKAMELVSLLWPRPMMVI